MDVRMQVIKEGKKVGQDKNYLGGCDIDEESSMTVQEHVSSATMVRTRQFSFLKERRHEE